ncbi:hypothetical protein E2C01_010027 [Portunus trituberculatus]|uniref:Uncharacterized protein n=1 Tax=Portunus trituberculatus TaxID=210409 RepID=A0A5B7D7C8_PORTR|nr:hypothetical protein [Portunus trituberculatus]
MALKNLRLTKAELCLLTVQALEGSVATLWTKDSREDPRILGPERRNRPLQCLDCEQAEFSLC